MQFDFKPRKRVLRALTDPRGSDTVRLNKVIFHQIFLQKHFKTNLVI